MLEFFYRLDLLLTGLSAATTVMAISVVAGEYRGGGQTLPT